VDRFKAHPRHVQLCNLFQNATQLLSAQWKSRQRRWPLVATVTLLAILLRNYTLRLGTALQPYRPSHCNLMPTTKQY